LTVSEGVKGKTAFKHRFSKKCKGNDAGDRVLLGKMRTAETRSKARTTFIRGWRGRKE